jgi:ABC-type amino acid transport substrate-binding protein
MKLGGMMERARKLLLLSLALVLALAVLGVTGCSSDDDDADTEESTDTEMAFDTLTEGKIIVGSDTAYPPFENVDGGETVGFDVDLMMAVGDVLGIDVEFMTYNFDALITDLQAGTQFDMVASAMTITEERAESVDFSDPYINSNQSLAVSNDSGVTSTDDLAEGDKVGVQSGTTGEMWATENLESMGIVVVPYSDILAAFGALQAGDVLGVINDAPISQDVAKDETRNITVSQEIATGEQYGFAFNQDSDDLREAVNDALDEIKDDGTYEEIYEKWFGAPPMSIP